jgi:zinc D-Ala-D-Ala carboxypeptidase
MKLTEHVTYNEATQSFTAKRLGINNIPTEDQMFNMITVATEIFEPLRKWVGGPIKINSFFRSGELNKAIGGSATSQHCQGYAMDLDDVYGYKTNAEMFDYITSHLPFDQIIWEFGDNTNPDWIHVSFVSHEKNRRNVLKAERVNGKTVYSKM